MSSQPTQTGPGSRARRWLKPAVGLGVASAVGVAVLWWGTSSGRDRSDGLRAARDGDFARAEPLLKQALDRNPDDAEAAEALARGYLAADDPHAAAYLSRW